MRALKRPLAHAARHSAFFARADEETVLAIFGELERVMKLSGDPFIFLI